MATTQISKNGTIKDIHDRRLPATIGTDGQVLTASNGSIVWDDSTGGITDVQVDSTSVVTSGVANITLSDFSITATSTELNYCDGVTSAIQTQLNTKQSAIQVRDLE